jgi:hypothetical protein
VPYVLDSNGNIKTIYASIEVSDIEDGTDGELLTWDASGVIATVSTGSAGNVLVSNGAGAAPTFQSLAGGVTQATQAAIEAETNEDTYIPPDLIKHTPGAAKAWVNFNGTGTPAISASYNVTSITDNGTGDYTVVWDTDFSGSDYAVAGVTTESGANSDSGIVTLNSSTAPATTGVRIRTVDVNSAADVTDYDEVCVVAMGDHA